MGAYHSSEIRIALRAVGLVEGDNVFVSAGLGMLGPPSDVASSEAMCAAFCDAIREVVGPRGTIFTPAYSYTFGTSTASSSSLFDPQSTPAEIGPFPNYFRCLPGVIRSLDPMMSIAGQGPKIDCLQNLSPTSYGPDSVFERFLGIPSMKCLNLGVGTNFTPFIHYAERMIRAPHRYDKLFSGHMVGTARSVTWHYPVRILCPEGAPSCYQLGEAALAHGIWAQTLLGRSSVSLCDYGTYFDFAMKQLTEDSWSLAKGPRGDAIALEAQRYPTTLPLLHDQDEKQQLANLRNAVMPVAGQAAHAVISLISSSLPCDESSFISGTWAGDWVMPEFWYPIQARLICPDGQPLAGVTPMPDSLSFSGTINAFELEAHIHQWGDKSPFKLHRGERDWGLIVPKGWCPKFGHYQVEISCIRGLGRMHIGQVYSAGQSEDEVIVFVDVERRIDAPDPALALVSIVHAARRLIADKSLPCSLRFVFAPGAPGFAAWYAHLRDATRNIAVILVANGAVCIDESTSSVTLQFGLLSDPNHPSGIFHSGLNPMASTVVYPAMPAHCLKIAELCNKEACADFLLDFIKSLRGSMPKIGFNEQ